MNLGQFYKKFEEVPREERFEPIRMEAKPTSLFVIFQMLTHVRARKRYYEEQEKYLLEQAEVGFKQREQNGK